MRPCRRAPRAGACKPLNTPTRLRSQGDKGLAQTVAGIAVPAVVPQADDPSRASAVPRSKAPDREQRLGLLAGNYDPCPPGGHLRTLRTAAKCRSAINVDHALDLSSAAS